MSDKKFCELTGVELPAAAAEKKDPFPGYDELAEYLKNLPATWYPALILEMVSAAWAKKVFVKGGASRLVASHEFRNGWEAAEDPKP